jgi:uncharacterized protein
MLFLPLLDRCWRPPGLPLSRRNLFLSLALIAIAVALLAWRPAFASYAVTTLLLAALPEEWFFRGYFMARLGNTARANLISSIFFSLLHGLTRGWLAAPLVFLPSLLFGWIFQRTRDLPLVILLHAVMNLVNAMFPEWWQLHRMAN